MAVHHRVEQQDGGWCVVRESTDEEGSPIGEEVILCGPDDGCDDEATANELCTEKAFAWFSRNQPAHLIEDMRKLLASADDTGCSDGLTVVSRAALDALASYLKN